jgi:hypothetical protein
MRCEQEASRVVVAAGWSGRRQSSQAKSSQAKSSLVAPHVSWSQASGRVEGVHFTLVLACHVLLPPEKRRCEEEA